MWLCTWWHFSSDNCNFIKVFERYSFFQDRNENKLKTQNGITLWLARNVVQKKRKLSSLVPWCFSIFFLLSIRKLRKEWFRVNRYLFFSFSYWSTISSHPSDFVFNFIHQQIAKGYKNLRHHQNQDSHMVHIKKKKALVDTREGLTSKNLFIFKLN